METVYLFPVHLPPLPSCTVYCSRPSLLFQWTHFLHRSVFTRRGRRHVFAVWLMVCGRRPLRSSTPPAPVTRTQGRPRGAWRPSTRWRSWAWASTRSGTRTTRWPLRSPWRTRYVCWNGMCLFTDYKSLLKKCVDTKLYFACSWLRDWRWPWTRLLYPTQGETLFVWMSDNVPPGNLLKHHGTSRNLESGLWGCRTLNWSCFDQPRPAVNPSYIVAFIVDEWSSDAC